MEMLKPPPPERKERGPMKQSDFYLAMVAGMVAIVIALSVNAYATWTAVECTTVYYTEGSTAPQGGTVGRAHHTCFNRDGVIEFPGGSFANTFFVDTSITIEPLFPPLGE